MEKLNLLWIQKKFKHFCQKIKLFWYFLTILVILIFAHNTFAAIYSEDFDGYANGTNANTIEFWENSIGNCKVSDTSYYSSPNSLSVYVGVSGGNCVYNTNKMTHLSFFLLDPNNLYNGSTISFRASTTGVASISLDAYYPATSLTFSTNASSSIKTISTTTVNTWQFVNVYFDYNAGTMFVSDNYNEGKTKPVDLTNPVDNLVFYPNSGNSSSPAQYLDNISVSNEDDTFVLNRPTTAQVFGAPIIGSLPISDFDWNYTISISSTTLAAYSEFIIFLQYNNYDSLATGTGSGILDYYPASQFLASIPQIFTNTTKLPTNLGSYDGNLYLYGDTTLLKTVPFSFSFSTSTTPETWCENLCSDLVLTQATTTPVWGVPIPWLEPHFLNDGFCAIRYGACYLFWPDSDEVNALWSSAQNFETVFPFSAYFSLASTTSSVLATSTNLNGSFSIPFLRKTATSSQVYMLPVLSSSSMPNLIGQDNTATFRLTMGWLIWLITAGMCITMIILFV